MSEHLRQSIQFLEQEQAALMQRHAEIARAIEALRPFVGGGAPAITSPAITSPATKPASHRAAAPVNAAGLQELGDRVVAALRRKNPQRPGGLATAAALSLEGKALRQFLEQLAAAGRIERSGTGRGAVVRLPGTTAAKEAP